MKPTRSHALVILTLVFAVLFLGASGLALAQDPTPPAGSPSAEPLAPAAALGAAFTYQGRLADGGAAANGAYDFQFKLFDALSAGTQIGGTVSKNDLAVSSGLFTTDLDFGAGAFDGQARWLEVAVRPGASTGAYTPLAPRRSLLASPYATYSNNTRGFAVTTDGRVGIGTSDPGTSNLRIQGATSIGTRMFVGNSGNGEAAVYLDASNGDFEEGDYAWIAQYDNLDLGIGNGVADRITVKPDGKVGIGTANPQVKLQIDGSVRGDRRGALRIDTGDGWLEIGPQNSEWAHIGTDRPRFYFNTEIWVDSGNSGKISSYRGDLVLETEGLGRMGIQRDGNIDIDFNRALGGSPSSQAFTYDGRSMGHYSFGWFGDSWNGQGATAWLSGFAGVKLFSGGAPRQVITADGRVGIGTDSPQARLDVAGTTRTDVLQIDAGADLAEPFAIVGMHKPEPGLVVAIDPDHIGQLRIADKAYDRTVAGVISGAGGLQPGLTMQQPEVVQGEAHPVALSGRVYVWADASFGAIQPGDLLTTSITPGHAMKAGDYAQAQGAILGKAMSRLEEGKGLVLVLVSLQ